MDLREYLLTLSVNIDVHEVLKTEAKVLGDEVKASYHSGRIKSMEMVISDLKSLLDI